MNDLRVATRRYIALTRAEFEQYIEGMTVDEVETYLSNGRFGGEAEDAARLFVVRSKAVAEREREQQRLDLERRSVAAAEDSAKSARASARWSLLSLVTAAAALIVAAWPYIKTPKSWWPF